MASLLLKFSKPVCPYCGTSQCVVLNRSWHNAGLVFASGVIGFFVTDLIRVEWLCKKTGKLFKDYSFGTIQPKKSSF